MKSSDSDNAHLQFERLVEYKLIITEVRVESILRLIEGDKFVRH